MNSLFGRFSRLPVSVGMAASRCPGDEKIGSGEQEKMWKKDDGRGETPGPKNDYTIRIRSQSGQIQVGPLLIPHLFSLKQASQI
jgi:hypothetical protein